MEKGRGPAVASTGLKSRLRSALALGLLSLTPNLYFGCGDGEKVDGFSCDESYAFDASNTSPVRLRIEGRDLLGPDGETLQLRGANLKNIDAEQARELREDLQFNFVRMRISFEGDNRDDNDPTGFSAEFRAELDAWVEALAAEQIWILLEMRSDDETTNDPALYDPSSSVFAPYARAWEYLGCRYRTADYVAGYGLLAEPSASRGDKEPVDTLTAFQLALMERIDATGDTATPYFVGPDYNYDTMQYRYDEYFTALAAFEGRLVYEVNSLVPKPWIQDGTVPDGVSKAESSYPQPAPANFDFLLEPKEGEPFEVPRDLERIFSTRSEEPENFPALLSPEFEAWYLSFALAFAEKHQVPMVVDQFGASTFAAGQLAYEQDLLTFFEQNGLGWARWSYNAGTADRMIQGNPEVFDFYAALPP